MVAVDSLIRNRVRFVVTTLCLVVAVSPLITALGVLYDALPGNDYCNGYIAPTQLPNTMACMVDCLHVEDVAALLAEKGLEKRPAGK